MFFLLVVNYNPSVFDGHEDTEPYIFRGKDLLGVTWRHRSRDHWTRHIYVVSYWWSIVSMRLICTVTEI